MDGQNISEFNQATLSHQRINNWIIQCQISRAEGNAREWFIATGNLRMEANRFMNEEQKKEVKDYVRTIEPLVANWNRKNQMSLSISVELENLIFEYTLLLLDILDRANILDKKADDWLQPDNF